MYQSFEYSRIVSIARVLNFQSYTEFTHFRKYDRVSNMRRDAIIKGF